MSASSYRKLTPKRWRISGASQVWLGPDHVLVVNSNHFTENYQRYSFNDIQAIVVAEVPPNRAGQIVAAILAFSWGALAFAVQSLGAVLFFAITAAIALAFVFRSLARPARCMCAVQTSVSRESLKAVWHRGVADRFLATLVPALEAAQQHQVVAESPPIAESGVALPEGRAATTNSILNPPPPPVMRRRNFLAEVLFALFLADALLLGVVLGFPGSNLLGLVPTVYLTEAVLAVLTISLKEAKPSPVVSTLIFVCLAVLAADIFAGSGVAAWRTFLGATRPETARLRWGSWWLSPNATLIVTCAWRLVAGVLGLAILIPERRRSQ